MGENNRPSKQEKRAQLKNSTNFKKVNNKKGVIGKDVITVEKIKETLSSYFLKHPHIKILNVGAKGGVKSEFDWIFLLGQKTESFSLEYDLNYVEGTEHSFYGDICSCPQIPDNSFDIVYILNVLEHTKEPWEAAKECYRICKPGGVIIAASPFDWYYHKHPIDFWRFTHEGLKYLFERAGTVETMEYGFKNISWINKDKRPAVKGIQSLYVCKKK